MIVDTSAVVAIIFQEPGFEEILHELALAEEAGIGAPTLVDVGLVLSAKTGKDVRFIHSGQRCRSRYGA